MKNRIYYLIVFCLICLSCGTDDSEDIIVVDSEVAQANPAPESRECEATNVLVGESRDLRESDIYGISGVVTIVSDCEIEISNFFYNGLGPNVSVYGGVDGDYESGVNMSEPLNGRSFEGETLNLFLPEGSSFDDINSFSIWCFEFDVDFSSASFQ